MGKLAPTLSTALWVRPLATEGSQADRKRKANARLAKFRPAMDEFGRGVVVSSSLGAFSRFLNTSDRSWSITIALTCFASAVPLLLAVEADGYATYG